MSPHKHIPNKIKFDTPNIKSFFLYFMLYLIITEYVNNIKKIT